MSEPRWVRVLQLLADEGLTQRQVATRLQVSLRTIKGDLIFARWALGARTTTQAVAIAIRSGRIK